MNGYMKLLFVLTATGIATVWFAQGLLNPFVKAVFSIVVCALDILFTFFFGRIGKLSNVIENKITKPYRKIHFPPLFKALLYFSVGVLIWVLDNKYATSLYAEDQATFYPFVITGKKYWITENGFFIGGFFVFLSAMYVLGVVLRALNKLLNQPIQISIVVNK